MNITEAATRMRALFPGKYVSVEVRVMNDADGETRVSYMVYTPHESGDHRANGWLVSGPAFDPLLTLAQNEAERRALASAAAHAATQDPAESTAVLTQEIDHAR